ncbi:hypothetical protein [Burkholderia gladioli]|uniref:hypothetical protein n=1 Tax=Burkholderia gladioli TaxID=28095 RepID=UPI00163FB875|nr:hypothetical protein [Burkholderia gladioli]
MIELYVTRQKSPAGAMFPDETIRTGDPASDLQSACSATRETGAQQDIGRDHSLRVRACARCQRTGRRRRRIAAAGCCPALLSIAKDVRCQQYVTNYLAIACGF